MKNEIRREKREYAGGRDWEKKTVAEKWKEQGKHMRPEDGPEWVEKRVNGGKNEDAEEDKAQDKRGQRGGPKKREEKLKVPNRKGKEKEKIEKLLLPPVFDFLQSPFLTHKGQARLPGKSASADSLATKNQSTLGPGEIFRTFFND